MVRAITRYGRELGEAFALRDDLLGVWGNPERTGKPAGDDLLSGKPTVILALADERLRGSDRALLAQVGTPELSPADVAHLQDALQAAGVVDAVESRISGHVHAAVAALDHPASESGRDRRADRHGVQDRLARPIETEPTIARGTTPLNPRGARNNTRERGSAT